MTPKTPLAVFFAIFALSVAAPTAQADDLEVVRVQKTDGSVVPGFILEKQDDGILVRSADGDVFIPWTDIEAIEHISSPVEPTAPPVQSTPIYGFDAPLDRVGRLRLHPAWDAYAAERIRLVDKRGRPIGPASLGYSSRDFGRHDDDRFHAVVAGDYLTIPEFVHLSRSDVLLELYERQHDKAQRKVDVGFGFLALSGGLGVVGFPLAIGGGSAGDATALFIGPGLIGWSIATLVIAASFHRSAFGRISELRDVDLEELIDRPEAWQYVQEHNRPLRQENGLPNTEEVDGPDT
jgi:hypothetical protein